MESSIFVGSFCRGFVKEGYEPLRDLFDQLARDGQFHKAQVYCVIFLVRWCVHVRLSLRTDEVPACVLACENFYASNVNHMFCLLLANAECSVASSCVVKKLQNYGLLKRLNPMTTVTIIFRIFFRHLK